ncbi:hypothetical protein [Pedobacter boryungensis]|uniref:Uncharacterized protein n=1 Tax=Pedobacter boryungensis TaxID=869962 RepID=A0ABX2DD28_9SPHI|nr:hypothetical protein [Pedobacter boryungensis]NQX31434.1 hypothetical protein [Pedobacter boryungensis]
MRGVRYNRTVVRITETKHLPTKPNWFERNQGFIQFLMMVLTLVALGATIYFSQQSLKQSSEQLKQGKIQLKQASEQLNLAQSQFKESVNQRKIDSGKSDENEKIQNKRFDIQNNINKKNLNAIELQAKIAQSQFEAQSKTTAELLYQNRPIFMIGDANFDTLENRGHLMIRNIGKRPAKIIRSKLFAFDANTYKRVRVSYTPYDNLELNENSLGKFSIEMYKGEFDDNRTLYYLHFVYEDVINGENKHFQKFFTLNKTDGKTEWAELSPDAQSFLTKQIIYRKFNLDLKTN